MDENNNLIIQAEKDKDDYTIKIDNTIIKNNQNNNSNLNKNYNDKN